MIDVRRTTADPSVLYAPLPMYGLVMHGGIALRAERAQWAVFAALTVVLAVLVGVLLVGRSESTASDDVVPLAPFVDPGYDLADVNPSGFIRFTDGAGAEQRRTQLIEAIWPNGSPSSRPVNVTLMEPEQRVGFAIIEQPHTPDPLTNVADALLAQGYAVVSLPMPHEDHATLMGQGGTEALQRFLDPSIEMINEFTAQDPTLPIVVVGLSGGGWTTSMVAAIDPRVDASFAVAGSLPLFARPFSPGSWGDTEQFWEPIYGEADTDRDGVPDAATGAASWLEVYALGALPAGRVAVQMFNRHDNCCFSGNAQDSYVDWLSDAFPGCSAVVDETNVNHLLVSDWTIEQIVSRLPALRDRESPSRAGAMWSAS